MDIKYSKHINTQKNNRIEFLLINFDYYDGNQLIVNILTQKNSFMLEDKIEGIYYILYKLSKNGNKYHVIWHEDVGNYIFSENQESYIIEELERVIIAVIAELNRIVK